MSRWRVLPLHVFFYWIADTVGKCRFHGNISQRFSQNQKLGKVRTLCSVQCEQMGSRMLAEMLVVVPVVPELLVAVTTAFPIFFIVVGCRTQGTVA